MAARGEGLEAESWARVGWRGPKCWVEWAGSTWSWEELGGAPRRSGSSWQNFLGGSDVLDRCCPSPCSREVSFLTHRRSWLCWGCPVGPGRQQAGSLLLTCPQKRILATCAGWGRALHPFWVVPQPCPAPDSFLCVCLQKMLCWRLRGSTTCPKSTGEQLLEACDERCCTGQVGKLWGRAGFLLGAAVTPHEAV